MTARDLAVGDVVQISPESLSAFRGCFMLVTEPKKWGAQGFVCMPKARDEWPGEAYFRAEWSDMEYVGTAAFVPESMAAK